MNRKQRRAQGSDQRRDAADVLKRPSDDKRQRQAKTLYEIAAEKQAELLPDGPRFDPNNSTRVVNLKVGADGKVEPLDDDDLPDIHSTIPLEEYSPLLDTLLLSISLSTLHFTLEALTVHQYAEQLIWKHVFWHTVLQAFPVLTLLVHTMHGHIFRVKLSATMQKWTNLARQVIYVIVANLTGCYLIQVTNDKGYMAVMRNAPSTGTVWVWCIIELGLAGALAGIAGPGAYAWWNGYGIY